MTMGVVALTGSSLLILLAAASWIKGRAWLAILAWIAAVAMAMTAYVIVLNQYLQDFVRISG